MSDLLKPPRFFILLALISLATVSAVLFTPALPELARAFKISPAKAQWAMSIYLFGFSLGPLVYGPLGNRIGRRKSLLWGVAICMIGSILAFFSGSFWILCLGRFIQAIGAAAGLKLTFTMVGDLHAGQGAVKTLSLLMLGLAIAPSFGITIGGILTALCGWKGCFAFLTLYSALIFWLSLKLPETAKHLDPDALQVRKIAHGYATQFKDFSITMHALLMGLPVAMIYIFANDAPYIAIDSWQITPVQYGFFNLLIPIGTSLGLLAGNRLAGKMAVRNAMCLGILVTAIGILAMFYCIAKHWYTGWSLFVPQSIIQMGGFFLWLFASSHGLSGATDKSNASAVMQCINIGTATLGTLFVGAFVPKVGFSIPVVFALLTVAIAIVWIQLRDHHRRAS